MLTIVIPEGETFDEKQQRFIKTPSYTLKLEHSLLSLWKWESKHHVNFINNKNLSDADVMDYIKCMTLSPVDDICYSLLTAENIMQIKDYIEDPMTATTFYDPYAKVGPPNKEIVTAEVIYSSMIILGIPIDIFEKRHLNHVTTLIKVCSEKQDPDSKSKVNPKNIASHYQELNRARRAKLNTKG